MWGGSPAHELHWMCEQEREEDTGFDHFFGESKGVQGLMRDREELVVPETPGFEGMPVMTPLIAVAVAAFGAGWGTPGSESQVETLSDTCSSAGYCDENTTPCLSGAGAQNYVATPGTEPEQPRVEPQTCSTPGVLQGDQTPPPPVYTPGSDRKRGRSTPPPTAMHSPPHKIRRLSTKPPPNHTPSPHTHHRPLHTPPPRQRQPMQSLSAPSEAPYQPPPPPQTPAAPNTTLSQHQLPQTPPAPNEGLYSHSQSPSFHPAPAASLPPPSFTAVKKQALAELASQCVPELQCQLRTRGLLVSGLRVDLLERLGEDMARERSHFVPAQQESLEEQCLMRLRVPELKELCRKKNLPVGGLKDDLRHRLVIAYREAEKRGMGWAEWVCEL